MYKSSTFNLSQINGNSILNASYLLSLLFILFCSPIQDLNGQCNGNTVLSISNGTTDTWLNNTGGDVTVRITAVGAGGGYGDVLVNNNPGGTGATMVGEFTVLDGQTIRAIAGSPGTASNGAAGGGGGSASGVVNCGTGPDCATGTILIVASGGGGGGLGVLSTDDGLGGLASTTDCSSGGGGGTGNSGAGGGGKDAPGAPGVAGAILATGGGQIALTGLASGGTGAGDGLGVLAGNGGNGMGGGGGGGLAEGGGGAGHTGGNAGGLVVGESGGTGGNSCNSGMSISNIPGTDGGGDNFGSVIVECLGLVLPIELVNFSAATLDDHIRLKWATASELNNMGFEIQHSTEINTWETIGFVDGQGTTNIAQEYLFVDDKPMPGTNYYRLQQIDFDGKSAYSPIAIGTIDSQTAQAIFYPNPSKIGLINLKLLGVEYGNVKVEFYDWTGRKVLGNILNVQDTNASFFTLNTDALSAGVYAAKIIAGKQKIVKRIMIVDHK